MAPREAKDDGAKESKEAETVRRSFEYRGADDRLLGTAEIELEGPEIDAGEKTAVGGLPGKARKLRSFVLRGEKDGAPTETDMLALTNRHGVEVLSSTEHLQNYHYNNEAKRVVVPPLETPLDVGVFLHELGHADQYHEERFRGITPLYGQSKPATFEGTKFSYVALAELLESVAEAIPDAKKVLDDEGLGQLRRLEDRRHDALDRKGGYERALLEQEGLRSDELQSLLFDAMKKRIDPDVLLAESKQLEERERPMTTPLKASPDVGKLVDRLTDAGLRFQEEYLESGLDKKEWRPEDIRFPAERELSAELLSETSITTAEQARHVLTQAVLDLKAHEAELKYDVASEELVVRVPFFVPGKRRTLAITLDVTQDEFEAYRRLREGADRQVRLLEEKVDQAYEDAEDAVRAQELLIDGLRMRDVAALPTRMMERDATRRALQWLRSIRQKTGVDLLAPHLVPPEALVATGEGPTEDCVASAAEGMDSPGEEKSVEASIMDDLHRALATYGADKMRLHPPDDEAGSGFIPVAGHQRPKKD